MCTIQKMPAEKEQHSKHEIQLQELKKEFEQDTDIIAKQTDEYLRIAYPGYKLNPDNISDYLDKSPVLLESIKFYRIICCKTDAADNLFKSLNKKIEKLITALHSINKPIAYGIISRSGTASIVIGICGAEQDNYDALTGIVKGMLFGVEVEEVPGDIIKPSQGDIKSYGILSGIPTVKLGDEKQDFSLASVMRTLNGEDYTLLVLAKPVDSSQVNEQLQKLITVRDAAFSVSKRNVSRNKSRTDTSTHTDNAADTTTHTHTQGLFAGIGIPLGELAPSLNFGFNISHSYSKGHTEGYSDSVSEAITNGGAIAADIQNGFALELMNYADKTIQRLKGGNNNGIWQTAICYSAGSKLSRNIISACLKAELSRPDPDLLPMLLFEPSAPDSRNLLAPRFLRHRGGNIEENPLCSFINSSELGLLCTPPVESVPDFELRYEKQFPMLKRQISLGDKIGTICDGKRRLKNMPFGLTSHDLNRHTFICGITGSGKTSTVKKILANSKVPFLVIEPAKKEYRNLNDVTVYTPGRPEINSPKINPFYILPGISPQMHIDFLKDLFTASFSFYGPMPYILEKCLHNIYKNKGWNLTMGFHPLLANTDDISELFELQFVDRQYKNPFHQYLFPTMKELKDEIERYIREELQYDGEVAGNVKTAMRVRLENLCTGAKGYMFNTNYPFDAGIFEKETVFELEGLADDADKAFCMGLLIVFINEYRQVNKEVGSQSGLAHLLVIEEAHRLLKNVDTKRSVEEYGNPEGKAVEHFTNMLAEMRAYGQGVIVAEQIPGKLAPDVVKNSANKIIQRIVSAEDQQLIANTIGIKPEDAIQLGTLEERYALCHTEGMALPVFVRIDDIDLSSRVTDGELYEKYGRERIPAINYSMLTDRLEQTGADVDASFAAFRLFNTLLSEKGTLVSESIKLAVSGLEDCLSGFVPLKGQKRRELILHYITDKISGWLVCGRYAMNRLPEPQIRAQLEMLKPEISAENLSAVKVSFENSYGVELRSHSHTCTAQLIKEKLDRLDDTDIPAVIKQLFMCVSDSTVNDIEKALQRRKQYE